jgi:hypothetical protein
MFSEFFKVDTFMKIKHIMLGVGLFFCNNIYSQNITNELIQFSKNADMDCYIAKIQKNINDYFILDNKNWGRDKYGIIPPKIELQKDEIVPMLTIQFINTDSFNLNNDIYNYITIDSTIVFTLACVNKKMKVFAFAHFFDGINGYYEIDKDPQSNNFFKTLKFKHIISNINKQKPELILYCHVLSGFQDDNGFMYVKNGKIYVYRVIEKDIYELNDYIRRFFSLDRIRNLNNTFIPMIYQLDQSTRIAGHTPENEKLLCQ